MDIQIRFEHRIVPKKLPFCWWSILFCSSCSSLFGWFTIGCNSKSSHVKLACNSEWRSIGQRDQTYTLTTTKCELWRCISLLNMWIFQPAMLVYQRIPQMVSNIVCVHPYLIKWVQFDYIILFKWVGSTTNYPGLGEDSRWSSLRASSGRMRAMTMVSDTDRWWQPEIRRITSWGW